jgi:iron(III) transport system substrate-binding protein
MSLEQINRRLFLGISAGAFVGSSAWSQSDNKAYFDDLFAQAKKEGELTWYIAHWGTDLANKVANAFTEAYPGVKVNVVRATSQVIYQRLTQDMKARVANCDVFSSADNGQYVTLKADNKLIAFEPKNLASSAPVLRDFDPQHFTTITDANPTVLCYNTKLVSESEAPKRWTDLLDPKWSGQIAVPHPGFSGAMGAWTVAMTNLYGWQFFEKLHKNKPFVARSLVDPPVTIGSGERKIGLSTVATAVGMKSRGQPIAPSYPEDGAMLNVGPTAIIAGAKHPNAARLFIEYLLSKPAGDFAAEEFLVPIRTDVKPVAGVPALGGLKGIKSDPIEISQKLPDLIEKWRDTFGV